MVTTYEKYLELKIDGAPIGLGYCENENSYFCTPKGAEVIGWAGVDGIHYCFVRGFGETVFAVSPMNVVGHKVHPVARNFADFLRLLLACGDTAALEQASGWDQAQFDAFLQDNPFTAEQQAVLDILRENLLLTPMEQPFTYIKELQAEFDYSLITEPENDEGEIPKWNVYFDGNFWGHDGREKPGRAIPIQKEFVWNNENWQIPAIYTCGKGLVVEFCKQVSAENIRFFLNKWNLSLKTDGSNFTDEQQMRIDAENPLSIPINPQVTLNSTVLSTSHGCGVSWNPCIPESNDAKAESVVWHYGLNPADGWAFWRAAFPWKTKRRPQIKTLSITLMQEPVAVPGPHFHVSASGECMKFTHPVTGTVHTLTIQKYEQQEFSHEPFGSDNLEFPTHGTVMSYTLSPDSPNDAFSVTDCVSSDCPRQKSTNPQKPQSLGGVCIGVIGGADGPTAIMVGGSSLEKNHTVCSALHFEPVDKVEWRIVFYVKKRDDLTVELL